MHHRQRWRVEIQSGSEMHRHIFCPRMYRKKLKNWRKKLCQRNNGPKALSTFTQNDTFSWKQKLQQALKSWSSWLLFCSDINKMAFVFIRHQQHDFSFVLASTTWFSFVLMSTTWLSKLTRVGKERLHNFWRGCVNIYMPGSHQSSLKKSTD